MAIKLKTKKSRLLVISIILVVIILLITAFWSGIVVRRYEVGSDRVTADVKLVLITDLHSYIYGEGQKDIADKIKAEKPDLLLLAGDIADDEVPITGTEQFLKAVSGVCPIYYVTGNHEFWASDTEGIKQTFKSYGVVVLEDEYQPVKVGEDELVIGGVDDPDKYRFLTYEDSYDYMEEKLGGDTPSSLDVYSQWDSEVERAFKPLQGDDRFRILLSHRPEKIDLYKRLPFDMILSGHAHGGQVRVPFLVNGLFSPNQGFFPKYAGGVYRYEGKTHIVSRGLAINPKIPRVFNPPELVVITLSPIKG